MLILSSSRFVSGLLQWSNSINYYTCIYRECHIFALICSKSSAADLLDVRKLNPSMGFWALCHFWTEGIFSVSRNDYWLPLMTSLFPTCWSISQCWRICARQFLKQCSKMINGSRWACSPVSTQSFKLCPKVIVSFIEIWHTFV